MDTLSNLTRTAIGNWFSSFPLLDPDNKATSSYIDVAHKGTKKNVSCTVSIMIEPHLMISLVECCQVSQFYFLKSKFK